MSILRRRNTRKGSPYRAAKPCSLLPGVILKIGATKCHILREDLSALELISDESLLPDYGFSKPADRTLTASPASETSLSTTSSSELQNLSTAQQEAKKPRRNLQHGERSCASCGATKTPYWREAWGDNIVLCNACGLRFSKFKKRCSLCHYVPRKEDKNNRCCSQCKGNWL